MAGTKSQTLIPSETATSAPSGAKDVMSCIHYFESNSLVFTANATATVVNSCPASSVAHVKSKFSHVSGESEGRLQVSVMFRQSITTSTRAQGRRRYFDFDKMTGIFHVKTRARPPPFNCLDCDERPNP